MRFVLPFLLALALVPACDRNNPEPPDTGPADSGRPRDGGADSPLEDAPFDGGADAPIDAPIPDVPGLDAPDAPPDAGPPCDDPSGCWACERDTEDHIIDHCTDATCEPFVNDATRLPLLEPDGSLPPLP